LDVLPEGESSDEVAGSRDTKVDSRVKKSGGLSKVDVLRRAERAIRRLKEEVERLRTEREMAFAGRPRTTAD
jgi:hypothetical protein